MTQAIARGMQGHSLGSVRPSLSRLCVGLAAFWADGSGLQEALSPSISTSSSSGLNAVKTNCLARDPQTSSSSARPQSSPLYSWPSPLQGRLAQDLHARYFAVQPSSLALGLGKRHFHASCTTQKDDPSDSSTTPVDSRSKKGAEGAGKVESLDVARREDVGAWGDSDEYEVDDDEHIVEEGAESPRKWRLPPGFDFPVDPEEEKVSKKRARMKELRLQGVWDHGVFEDSGILPPIWEFLPKDDKGAEKEARRRMEQEKQAAVAASRVKMVDELGRSYATGKRKCSIARVWVYPGSGRLTVNGKAYDDYFRDLHVRSEILRPFTETAMLGAFDIKSTVKGGGVSGQAGALRHGISKALQLFEPELRPALKAVGFLTRDPRIVERKKPGRKKARKSFQWVKR